jgi:glycosyltransferase involved in cell wall biosynthesis
MKAKRKELGKVTAIFIAYRAARTLEKFYNDFPKHLVDDIILVDDASSDDTFAIAQRLGIKSYKNVINLGYGGNLKKALGLALEQGAEVIIDLHPDGEYFPSAIAPALEEIKAGANLVLGNRYFDGNTPLGQGMFIWKYLPLIGLNIVPQLVIKNKISDFHQGFRVYTRTLLESVNFQSNSNDFLFSFEIIAQADYHNFRIAEVPVETSYTGKKRGCSFKDCVIYTPGVFKVLGLYWAGKAGLRPTLFRKSEPPEQRKKLEKQER